MEVTSFPFLTQDDFSHFHTWFQEMDGGGFNEDNNEIARKRRRKDDEESELKLGAEYDNFASVFLFNELEKQNQDPWVIESELEKLPLAMNEFNNQIQIQSELNIPETPRPKRGRKSAENAGISEENPVQLDAGSGHQRRLWVKDRSKDWWERRNHPDCPEEDFRQAFRMSKSTFNQICEELEPVVMKKNTMLRDAIPVRQRVAVCIWRLATGEPLRLVAKKFGLGISTCHKLVLEVCAAIKGILMPKFIQWPEDTKLTAIKSEFESISGISNVAGAMYTTHIPIIAPKNSVSAYFNKRHTERNQKTSYSITLQGAVDPKGIFTDVCIGWPGSMTDDQVLEKSVLYERANRGLLKDVRVIGNSGYPLMDWVLVPYTHPNLTWTQHAFNEKIGEIQKTAKEAFMRLKGRWTFLQKRTEVKLQDLPAVLGACCVLHNICEMNDEEMDPALKLDLFDDEMVCENNLRSGSAVQARDHIAHNLLHHGLAGARF